MTLAAVDNMKRFSKKDVFFCYVFPVDKFSVTLYKVPAEQKIGLSEDYCFPLEVTVG